MRSIGKIFVLISAIGLLLWGAVYGYKSRKAEKQYPVEKNFYFIGDPSKIHDGDQLVILRNPGSDLHITVECRKAWNLQQVRVFFRTERREIGMESFRLPYWKKSFQLNAKNLDPDTFVKIIFRFDEKTNGPIVMNKSVVRTNLSYPKILVLGLDGASLRILEPLVESGRCPNFKRLMRDGAYGDLTSEEPTYSPVIWTTLATGRPPDHHGITFYLAKSGLPVSSNAIKVKRFWEIFSEYSKLSSVVVGWYLTWPVEELNGAMISDRAYYNFKARDLSYPPGIFDQDYQRVHLAVNDDMLNHLKRFSSYPYQWDWKKKFPGGSKERELASIVHQRLMHVYRRDTSYAEFGLKLHRTLNPDVLALYLRGSDFTSHGFWKFRAPHEVPFFSVSEQEKRWFRDVIDNYYIYLDELLGKYLKLAGEGSTIFVLSDHGFQAVSEEEAESPELSGTHHINGILFCKGPAFRKGFRITHASIYDFLPTMLTVAGLPQAADMPGRVLMEAMESKFVGKNPLKKVKTYGVPKGVRQEKSNRKVDEEIKDELRSLGYIQ